MSASLAPPQAEAWQCRCAYTFVTNSLEGNRDEYPKDVDYGTLISMVNEKVAAGVSRSDAIREVASVTGISRKRLYELVHSKDN